MSDRPGQTREALFASVLKGLLRPLVRALIASGVTAPTAYRLLKEVYVEVAEGEFALDGKRQTDSRIHLLTGVHRKDVRAIREAGFEDREPTRIRVALLTSLVGRWLGDPETTDADGRPLALPPRAAQGPSFERLAREVSTDMRPRTLLDEMLAQRLVTVHSESGNIALDPEAIVGPADLSQKVHFFAENVADHIAAATENLLAEEGKAPFFERAVFYNRLTPGSVDAIEATARALGTEALGTVNRIGLAHQNADADLPEATSRFRFGIVFYRTEDPDRPNDEKEPK